MCLTCMKHFANHITKNIKKKNQSTYYNDIQEAREYYQNMQSSTLMLGKQSIFVQIKTFLRLKSQIVSGKIYESSTKIDSIALYSSRISSCVS